MTIFNFSLLNVPFANGAPSNEIADFPDFDRGLGIAFDQTDGKPEMKGLNGLFQQITTSIVYLKQRGIAEWDSSLEYPVGAFVTSGGVLYKAIAKSTGRTPATSQSSWQAWASVSDIAVSTNGNLKKTANTNGTITLEVPTATDSQRGALRFATDSEVANGSNVQAAVRPNHLAQKVSKTGDTVTGSLLIDKSPSSEFDYSSYPIRVRGSWGGGIAFIDPNVATWGIQTKGTDFTFSVNGKDKYWFDKNGSLSCSNVIINNVDLGSEINKRIGVNQSWQNLTSSRAKNTTYTNNTGRPIQVSVCLPDTGNGSPTMTVIVGGVTIAQLQYDGGSSFGATNYSFIVPDGNTYRVNVTSNGTISNWSELR